MKINYRNQACLLLAGIIALTGLTGCAAVVAGGAAAGATYAYVSGWLERDYQANLKDTYQAGLQAVKNLDMSVIEKDQDLSSAQIKASLSDTEYWIKMESKTDKLTKVSVRAGLMGDERASTKVHEAIEKAL
jgi:hypothetical protein